MIVARANEVLKECQQVLKSPVFRINFGIFSRSPATTASRLMKGRVKDPAQKQEVVCPKCRAPYRRVRARWCWSRPLRHETADPTRRAPDDRVWQRFDASNLRYMRLFYQAFPKRDVLRHELSWTHYRTLLRLEDPRARTWYMREAASQNWSSRALERQIGTLYYERPLTSKDRKTVRNPNDDSARLRLTAQTTPDEARTKEGTTQTSVPYGRQRPPVKIGRNEELANTLESVAASHGRGSPRGE